MFDRYAEGCKNHVRLSQRDPPQDVNQSLVDDRLVDMDKIGSSNFFWSFPSKVAVTKQNLVDSLKEKLAKVNMGGRLSECLPTREFYSESNGMERPAQAGVVSTRPRMSHTVPTTHPHTPQKQAR